MHRRLAMVVGAAGAAVMLLAWASSAEPPELWREVHLDVPVDLGPQDTTPVTLPPGLVVQGAGLGWLVTAIATLLGVVAVIVLVWWLSRRQWSRPPLRAGPDPPFAPLPEIAPDELLDAADEFDTLIARGSARNAIVACWVRLEQAVEQAGLTPNPAETPTEMTTRVLRAYAVDAESIGTLAALYREARFSTHEMREDHRRQAQQALADIRAQLRAAADQAAQNAAP
jgi:uncharacterized protein DUF4129